MNQVKTASLPSFATAYNLFLAFVCDGSCNAQPTDICIHIFEWICPECGGERHTVGESMPDVKELTAGACDHCFYDKHFPSDEAES